MSYSVFYNQSNLNSFRLEGQLHNAIGNIIPKLIKLLRDSDSIVRITAAIAIKKLARHGGYQSVFGLHF